MKTMTTTLAAALLGATALVAGDWTQFRGPGAAGVSDETGLPLRWGKTENVAWAADLPGRGLSNPVIVGGRVFVTACSGHQQDRLHVLCLDASSGKPLWQRQLWATGSTMCHPKTNMAAPTPATDGRRLYALFATCDLACLDFDGNLLWYRALAKDYPTVGNNVGLASSPVLAGDTLVLFLENAGESFALGVDKSTGQNRWKVARDREINWVTPLVRGDSVLFLSTRGLAAHDAKTGERRWLFESKGLSTIPSPVSADGLILVPAGGQVLALREADQGPPTEVWRSPKLGSSYATPLYYRGRAYNVNSTTGIVTCVDAADGKVLGQSSRLKGPFSASPVAADGRLYLVSEEGTTFVVEAEPTLKLLATNPLGETVLASPAIAGGAIYLRSDQHLFCIRGEGR